MSVLSATRDVGGGVEVGWDSLGAPVSSAGYFALIVMTYSIGGLLMWGRMSNCDSGETSFVVEWKRTYGSKRAYFTDRS